MIRHPNWPLSGYSDAYKREELIRLNDLRAKVNEYGGWQQLLNDITQLKMETENGRKTQGQTA